MNKWTTAENFVCVTSNSEQRRSAKGSQIAEFGPTLWILFLLLLFPMITFGTLGLRYVFLVNAARLAASAGAKCSTFQVDANPPKDCSAVNIANQIANQTANAFSHINITKVSCFIVSSPFAGGAISRQSTPLAKSADPNTNSYNFEVVIDGQLSPLVSNPSNWFVQIPGLGSPITTSARASVVFENTQGLTQ